RKRPSSSRSKTPARPEASRITRRAAGAGPSAPATVWTHAGDAPDGDAWADTPAPDAAADPPAATPPCGGTTIGGSGGSGRGPPGPRGRACPDAVSPPTGATPGACASLRPEARARAR